MNAKTRTALVHTLVRHHDEGSLGGKNMVARIRNHGFLNTHLKLSIPERKTKTFIYWQQTMKIDE